MLQSPIYIFVISHLTLWHIPKHLVMSTSLANTSLSVPMTACSTAANSCPNDKWQGQVWHKCNSWVETHHNILSHCPRRWWRVESSLSSSSKRALNRWCARFAFWNHRRLEWMRRANNAGVPPRSLILVSLASIEEWTLDIFFLPYIAVFLYYIHVLFIPGLALQSLCFGSLMIDVLCSILKMMYVTLDDVYHKWIIMMAWQSCSWVNNHCERQRVIY